MLRSASLASLLLCLSFLASCRSPVPVWNDNGEGMTDLRTLRNRGKQSITLTPGVRLHADSIQYADKRKRAGEATGNVLLVIEPAVRYEWMMKYGYAGRAVFDKKHDFVVLADRPMLERQFMTQIATEPYTTIEVRWESRIPEVIVQGPTRTDFAKSHPIPPGAILPRVPAAAEPVPQALPYTLPHSGLSKR